LGIVVSSSVKGPGYSSLREATPWMAAHTREVKSP
jgi:hypothetical protein